jgi:hypothetical protein
VLRGPSGTIDIDLTNVNLNERAPFVLLNQAIAELRLDVPVVERFSSSTRPLITECDRV